MVGNGIGKAAIGNVGATGKTNNTNAADAKPGVAAIAAISKGSSEAPTVSTSALVNAGAFTGVESAAEQYLAA